MKCPRCQQENEVAAKFCEECATPLARACTKCGRQLSPAAKFWTAALEDEGLIGLWVLREAAPLPEYLDRTAKVLRRDAKRQGVGIVDHRRVKSLAQGVRRGYPRRSTNAAQCGPRDAWPRCPRAAGCARAPDRS
jgi:hypothetical protein